jgi:hypothetical protein
MNVRELKRQIYVEAGEIGNGVGGFYVLSEELGAFMEKLNSIGARNIKTLPPDTVSDIDSTVELEASETEQLIAEFRFLFAKVK